MILQLSGNTFGLTMKSLTVKIPEALETKLRNKAKAGNEPVSAVVRRALAREMEADVVDFPSRPRPIAGCFPVQWIFPPVKVMEVENLVDAGLSHTPPACESGLEPTSPPILSPVYLPSRDTGLLSAIPFPCVSVVLTPTRRSTLVPLDRVAWSLTLLT